MYTWGRKVRLGLLPQAIIGSPRIHFGAGADGTRTAVDTLAHRGGRGRGRREWLAVMDHRLQPRNVQPQPRLCTPGFPRVLSL